MARPSWGLRLCWCNASSSWSFDREQDHVVAGTGGHELEAPKPNHRGARDRRNESGHSRMRWEVVKNTQDPYLVRQLSVFSPRGVTPTSEFVCVPPFPDGDAKRHKDLSWFRQEKALHPAGGSLYYFAPKYLYRGEYKCGMEGDGVWKLYYCRISGRTGSGLEGG